MSETSPNGGASFNPAVAADAILSLAPTLARGTVSHFYRLHPQLWLQHGPQGLSRLQQHCDEDLAALAWALRCEQPTIMADYCGWLLHQGQQPTPLLLQRIELLGQQVRAALGEQAWSQAQRSLDAGLRALAEPRLPALAAPPIAIMRSYLRAVLSGDRIAAQDLVLGLFRDHMSLRQIYLEIFQPALYEIGRLWQNGTVSVAQENLATAITQTILAQLYALQADGPRNGQVALVACLHGNHHEIGARMIADLLQLAGYDTHFLGASTADDDVLAVVEKLRPTLIGLPSTLSSHVVGVRVAIDKIRSDFASVHPTILVGGMAFNGSSGLWREVGADLWGRDGGVVLDALTATA